jgi:hypothetical protein
MDIGSNKHKAQWAEENIKNTQESIWVIEVSLHENAEAILAKKRELIRIEQRLETKFYPTARDGREDKKMREMELAGLEGNRERMEADRRRYESQIEAVRNFIKAE